MSDRSKELAAAIKKLADDLGTNARVVGAWRRHALIQPKDRAKEKWLRTVLAFPWEGREEVALLAWWIAELMDWDKGRLGSCNSIRDLEAVTGMPRATVQRHLAKLIANGFLVAPTRAAKQRGALLVPEATQALEAGQCRIEHLSDKYLNIVKHLTSGPPMSQITENGSGPPMGQICDDLAHPWDSLAHPRATYPSLPSPVNEVPCQLQGSSSPIHGEQTPTTEASLPSLPSITSLHVGSTSEQGIVRARVADAPLKKDVPATNGGVGLGYGHDIVGLEVGEATGMIRELQKIDPSIINVDAAWHTLSDCAKRHGGDKLRAAILDLRQKAKEGRLQGAVLRKLDGYCRGFATAGEAQERLQREVDRLSKARVYRMVEVRR